MTPICDPKWLQDIEDGLIEKGDGCFMLREKKGDTVNFFPDAKRSLRENARIYPIVIEQFRTPRSKQKNHRSRNWDCGILRNPTCKMGWDLSFNGPHRNQDRPVYRVRWWPDPICLPPPNPTTNPNGEKNKSRELTLPPP